jgi:hypothetical protein
MPADRLVSHGAGAVFAMESALLAGMMEIDLYA